MSLTELLTQGLGAYSNFQHSHPLIGSMLTAECTFTTGDAVSQLITDRKINFRKLKYTALLAPFYGIGVHETMESGKLVAKFIHDDPLTKAILGPNLWGNALNTIFFVNNTIGAKENYSPRALVENYVRIIKGNEEERDIFERFNRRYLSNIPKKEFLFSLAGTLTFWNVFQYFNYSYLEESMQTPACLVASVGWLALLSFWSLKGGRKIATSNLDNV